MPYFKEDPGIFSDKIRKSAVVVDARHIRFAAFEGWKLSILIARILFQNGGGQGRLRLVIQERKGEGDVAGVDVVEVKVQFLHGRFGGLRVASAPCHEIPVELQRQHRSVTHPRAREPVEEVYVDNVQRHQHVLLLLRAQEEMFPAEKHFQYVETRTHPAGVMGGAQTVGHLEIRAESNQELQR